jgi:hypothetical protein
VNAVVPALLAALAAVSWPSPPRPSRTRLPATGLRRGRNARGLDGVDPGGASRQPATAHHVADALVLLSLALRSGMGQREALERVALVSDGQIASHLRSVAAALRWGRPGREAWGYVADVWRPAALAWELADRAGAAPAQLVEEAAWRIRDGEDRRLQAAAARAGVRLVLPLGLAFLPAFACTAVVPVVLALAHTVLGP